MRKIKHYSLLFSFAIVSQASEYPFSPIGNNNFFLTGSVTEKSVVILKYTNSEANSIKDTFLSKKACFYFSGKINGTSKATLSIYNLKGELRGEAYFFLSMSKIHVKTNNPGKSIQISGSAVNDENENLNIGLSAIDKRIDSVSSIYNKSESQALLDPLNSFDSKRTIDSLQKARILLRKKFAASHSNSFLSPEIILFLFKRSEINYADAKRMYGYLSKNVKESLYGIELKKYLDIHQNSMVGMPAPPFAKTDINGTEINLSDFKNKNYILLNYWASYCLPCRKHVPQLKDLYSKYKDQGLKIIAVSWDFDRKACLNAIKEDTTNDWINIHGLSNQQDKDPFLTIYSVSHIPVYILIDPNGIIIDRNEEGDMNKLEQKLKEVFSSPDSDPGIFQH